MNTQCRDYADKNIASNYLADYFGPNPLSLHIILIYIYIYII